MNDVAAVCTSLSQESFFINCYLKANKKRCVLNNFVSQHKGRQGVIIRLCSQNQCFEFPLMCNQPTSQRLGHYLVYSNHINCTINTVDDIVICFIN